MISLAVAALALGACGGGGAGVSGTVTQDSDPLEGVTVKLFPSTEEEAERLGVDEEAAETTTDDNGEFTFEGVEPGEYSVTP